jgi:hypothetical protein
MEYEREESAPVALSLSRRQKERRRRHQKWSERALFMRLPPFKLLEFLAASKEAPARSPGNFF